MKDFISFLTGLPPEGETVLFVKQKPRIVNGVHEQHNDGTPKYTWPPFLPEQYTGKGAWYGNTGSFIIDRFKGGKPSASRDNCEYVLVMMLDDVGDPEKTATWKLPIKSPDDDVDWEKRHIRNALARFEQTKGQRPKPWPDLDDGLTFRESRRGDNLANGVRVVDEVLPPLFRRRHVKSFGEGANLGRTEKRHHSPYTRSVLRATSVASSSTSTPRASSGSPRGVGCGSSTPRVTCAW